MLNPARHCSSLEQLVFHVHGRMCDPVVTDPGQIGSLAEMQPRFEAAQRDVQRLRQEQAELRGSLGTVRRGLSPAVIPRSMAGIASCRPHVDAS